MMKPDLVAGSPLWQTVFVSFAVVLLLFQVLRGWRLGLPRQLVRLVALLAAYGAAFFGGKMILPFLRSYLQLPDVVISALGGALLAMILYSAINSVGTILFKRTGQHESPLLRLVFGLSGAFLGLLFGLFFIWLYIFGIRAVGAVAEAQVNASGPSRIAAFQERPARAGAPAVTRPTHGPDQDSLAMSLARLKKSLELGSLGNVVKQTDILPGGIYETLAHVGEVFSKPERAVRFLSYPGVAELADSPKVLALRADPEIARMLEDGRLFELLQDQRLIEAVNDPELAALVKKFDLKGALEYAAKEN